MPNRRIIILAAILASLLSGCGKEEDKAAVPKTQEQQPAPTTSQVPTDDTVPPSQPATPETKIRERLQDAEGLLQELNTAGEDVRELEKRKNRLTQELQRLTANENQKPSATQK